MMEDFIKISVPYPRCVCLSSVSVNFVVVKVYTLRGFQMCLVNQYNDQVIIYCLFQFVDVVFESVRVEVHHVYVARVVYGNVV